MTFLEAITALENRVDKIRLRDKYGNPLCPIVAMGVIGRYHGVRYDHVIQILGDGLITVEEYFTDMMKMIMEYHQRYDLEG